MRYRLFFAASLIGGMLTATLMTGCTVVGMIAGASASTKSTTMPGAAVAELDHGQRVRLSMKNDSTIETVYRGAVVDNADQYADRYANWILESPGREAFPPYASKVTVVPDTGSPFSGSFYGFDLDGVYLKASGKPPFMKLSGMLSLSNEKGELVTGGRMVEEVVQGGVPLRQQFSFEDEHGNHSTIDPRGIREIFVYGKNNVVAPMVLGMAIDALVIVLLKRSAFPSITVGGT